MRCEHCLDAIPKAQAVTADINGQQCFFCCRACLAVYQFLHHEENAASLNNAVKPSMAEQEKLANRLFRRFFLALVFAVQLLALLLASHFQQVLNLQEGSAKLFVYLSLAYSAVLMFLLLASLAAGKREGQLKAIGLSLYMAFTSVCILVFALLQFYQQSNFLYLGLFAVWAVVAQLLPYLDQRWRAIELYLAPALSVQRADKVLQYLGAISLFLACSLLLLCLPLGLEPAVAAFLSVLIVANPYVLRLVLPFALYSTDRLFRAVGIRLRSLRVLELLSEVSVVLSGREVLAQFKPLTVVELISGDTEEQALQLRLLQERHKVLLLAGADMDKALFNVADVSAVIDRRGTESLQIVADLVIADKPVLLEVLIRQARKFKRFVRSFFVIYAVYLLFILVFIGLGFVQPVLAFVSYCAVLLLQLVFARFVLGRSKEIGEKL